MSVAPVNQNSTINNDQPYPLPYDLRARIVSNIFFWSSIVLTLTIIPIIIYYPLIYLTSLSIGDVLGIVSIPNGLPSLIHLPMRLWKLWKQDDGDRRPLSGNIMDLFMWEYSISFIIIAAFYTVSTTIPIPSLYLMIPSMLVGMVSVQLLLSLFRPSAPIWISSLPPGHELRPAGYYIMEDVVAVDGGGRSAYRRALNLRYHQSPIFQRLISEMTIYWSIGGLFFIGISAIFVFLTSLNFAFAATLIWASLWPLFWFIPALLWSKYRLKQELNWFLLKNKEETQCNT